MPQRSFQAKLLYLIVGVLVLMQAATLLSVHVAGRQNLRQSVTNELRVGGRVFDSILTARGRQLSDTVRALAADFAFREAIASGDRPTITSALANLGARIDAHAAFLISLDGAVEADTLAGRFVGHPFPIPALLGSAGTRTDTSAVVSLDDRPFQLVAVPVLAPQPIAWICLGFRVDESVLEDVRRLTGLDASIWTVAPGAPAHLASTLPQETQVDLRERIRDASVNLETVRLGTETYASAVQPLETGDGSAIRLLLQRSIEEAQRPLRQLELQIFALSTAALLLAIVAAIFLARSVARPLRRLAEGAQRIGGGDYRTSVDISAGDEMGQLAAAFNGMRTEISGREEQIRFQATHDSLTGLPNRALFLDRLEGTIASAARTGNLAGIVVMDLDRFKEINDTLGHTLGDDLVVEIARRLQQTIRDNDTVARLGGDEFAVLFEAASPAGATDVAKRLSLVFATPFTLGGVAIDVDASMGIALYPLHADDAGTLLKRADVAMYQAKRNHDHVALYEPGRDEHSLRRLAVLSELRQAVAGDALELHYHPKVDMATGRAVHAEALVRWRHPVHGTLRPDEFIPLAEQSGNISMITKWVLKKAVAECALWQQAGLRMTVAVNLSAMDLYDAELPTLISGLLHERGLAPETLLLEITESALMRDPTTALKTLRELKSRGIALAIDDYGTGYSSLAHLKRLPVDELKIDKSFVMNLTEDAAEDAVIVRSTIELGHNMGLRVIAEGVESQEAYDILRRFGSDMAQGFYISRPLPAPDFVAWMKDSRWGSGPTESIEA